MGAIRAVAYNVSASLEATSAAFYNVVVGLDARNAVLYDVFETKPDFQTIDPQVGIKSTICTVLIDLASDPLGGC